MSIKLIQILKISSIVKISTAGAITVFSSTAEVVQHGVIVTAAEHPALHKAKLLSSGQLPFTGETGKTGQVVHTAPGPSHPVTGIHLSTTLGALCAKPTVEIAQQSSEGWVEPVKGLTI